MVNEFVPRLLNSKTAAIYIGISPRAFETLWRSGRVPAPIRLGRRVLWDRKVLDIFVDQLSGVGAFTQPQAVEDF